MPIIKVSEYGQVTIEQIEREVSAELGERTHLLLYPDVVASGVIQVTRRATFSSETGFNDVISPIGYVGLIPIADNVSLWVEPKDPVQNIDWMAKRYGGIVSKKIKELRRYTVSGDTSKSLVYQFAKAFLDAVEEIAARGYWHEYTRRSNSAGGFSGSLDISKTISLYSSRNINFKAATSSFTKVRDIAPNRVIKSALSLIARNQELGPIFKSRARRLLEGFYEVRPIRSQLQLMKEVSECEEVPISRQAYARALPLAEALLLNNGVDLTSKSGSVLMAPLLIDMAELFENYILQVLSLNVEGRTILSGNAIGNDEPLFTDGYDLLPDEIKNVSVNASKSNAKHSARPDILVFRNERLVLAADVKYKPIPESVAAKRGDIEQVVTYAERFGRSIALSIHPCLTSQESGLYYSGNIGKVSVFCYRINLSSDSLREEEAALTKAVERLSL